MFNKGKFYNLAKDLRETLRCKQETAEYLAALYQWAEEGLSNESYVCELQAVEDDCLTGGENDRSDLVSHGQYARCYGGAATIRLKRTDNESRNRKVSIGTARNRSLCQHQSGAGLALILW